MIILSNHRIGKYSLHFLRRMSHISPQEGLQCPMPFDDCVRLGNHSLRTLAERRRGVAVGRIEAIGIDQMHQLVALEP